MNCQCLFAALKPTRLKISHLSLNKLRELGLNNLGALAGPFDLPYYHLCVMGFGKQGKLLADRPLPLNRYMAQTHN